MTLNLDAATHRRLSSYSKQRKMSEESAVQALLKIALDREHGIVNPTQATIPTMNRKIVVSTRIRNLSNVPSTPDDTDYKDSLQEVWEHKYN